MTNPTLTLSEVPAPLIVGLQTTITLVTSSHSDTQSWELKVKPDVGLTISPPHGSHTSPTTTEVTIAPTVAGHYTITLTSTTGAEVSGSPVNTVALDPAVHRYLQLLADLETLKF